jgi:hypothetical protein
MVMPCLLRDRQHIRRYHTLKSIPPFRPGILDVITLVIPEHCLWSRARGNNTTSI